MTITVTPTKTYAQMLATLRERCGLHGTIGNAPALADILTEAHEYVYEQLDDGLPITDTITLSPNVATYPWVSDVASVPIARGSVSSVWIAQGSTERRELLQGINHAMRAYADMRDIPVYYDSKFAGDPAVFTLEVWPTPDQAYTVYVDHNRVLTRFSEPTDVPSAPYRLVLQYAIAMGKAHYKQPDAETAGQAFKTMLYKEHVAQKENKRFLAPRSDPLRPRVVSTAGGYRQVWD